MTNDVNKLTRNFHHGYYFHPDPRKAHTTEEKFRNYSTSSGDAEVVFDGIEESIIGQLETAEAAVGAVAWLTNRKILQALSRVQRVAIVVQKEDFLRRDSDTKDYSSWKKDLHDLYGQIRPFDISDFEAYPGIEEDNPNYDSNIQRWCFTASGLFINSGHAIRCLGYSNSTDRAIPRMHHKFLVIGQFHKGLILKPSCVITGSYNMTQNATRSRENILILQNKAICQAYFREWSQLWCFSESLNWDSPEPIQNTIHVGT